MFFFATLVLVVILDKETSVQYQCYMNISIHYNNEYIKVSLIGMHGFCGAEKILQLLKTHLADFGITNMQLLL